MGMAIKKAYTWIPKCTSTHLMTSLFLFTILAICAVTYN